VPVAPAFPRRDFLLTSATGGFACIAGCKPKSDTSPAPSARTDVPLRVLVCGDASWGDAISTAWGGIAQQPLAIEVVPLAIGGEKSGGDENAVGGEMVIDGGAAVGGAAKPSSPLARRVIAAMARNDVAIVPCGVIPDVYETESLMPLGDDVVADTDLAADRFFPVISESLMRWAGEAVAVPLGCLQPSMLVSAALAATLSRGTEMSLPRTWAQYDQVLQQIGSDDSGPAAAEPLADGAAAKMFLWRANDAAPPVWLFDRVTFEPVLTQETYVRTLETMRQSAQRYGQQRMTAGEVWSGIGSGQFAIALAWPAASGDPLRVESIGDAVASGLPSSQATAESIAMPIAVSPDPDAPLGVISSRCRQTVAAKRFLIWLSGGEGSQMIRSTVAAMTQIRSDSDRSDSENRASTFNDYASFLAQRLSSLNLRPTVRLHGYDRYMAELDRQVLACLNGEKTAVQSLAAASQAWQSLTTEIGPERQAKAWRLAQGLRN